MIYVKVNDELYPASIRGCNKDSNWDYRDNKAITLEMTYVKAAELFVDDVEWSIVMQNEETIEYDNSEFCVAGDITDHRDGTVTVKMGKFTTEELLLMEVLS